jgi:hypothetical protein
MNPIPLLDNTRVNVANDVLVPIEIALETERGKLSKYLAEIFF